MTSRVLCWGSAGTELGRITGFVYRFGLGIASIHLIRLLFLTREQRREGMAHGASVGWSLRSTGT